MIFYWFLHEKNMLWVLNHFPKAPIHEPYIYVPQHQNTYLWPSAPSQASDQPLHLFSLIKTFSVHKDSFSHADNKDSDQTAWMRRLIWVFVGRTCQKVFYLTLQLMFPWRNKKNSGHPFHSSRASVFILNIWNTSTFYHTCSRIKQSQFYHLLMCVKIAGWVPNSVDSDQMPHYVASDLSLHCVFKHVCPTDWIEVLWPSQPIRVMLSWSVYLIWAGLVL